jgi:hypothetical protein
LTRREPGADPGRAPDHSVLAAGHGIYAVAERPVELVDQMAAARLVLPTGAVVTGSWRGTCRGDARGPDAGVGQHRDLSRDRRKRLRLSRIQALPPVTVRVTADRMRRPRALVLRVHAELVERGYTGPPPTFSPLWCALFER